MAVSDRIPRRRHTPGQGDLLARFHPPKICWSLANGSEAMITSMLAASALSALIVAQPSPPPPPATGICKPVTGSDANTVEHLRGQYRVLGLRGKQPFAGSLVLDGRDGAGQITVSGLRDGKPTQGSARYVVCGPDGVRQLQVTLKANGATHTLFCEPHNDYDNYNRLSCSRRLSDPNGDMELWQETLTP